MLRAPGIITALFISILIAACGGGSGGTAASVTQNQGGSAGGAGSAAVPDGNAANSGNDAAPSGNAGSNNGAAPPGSPTGVFQVDATARFHTPVDVAADSDGNLYVLDGGTQFIRKIARSGEVTTLAGGPTISKELEADASGNVFVLEDTDVVRISADGSRAVVASYPRQPASYLPLRLALDAQGRLYVLLGYRNIFRIDRIAPASGSAQTVYSFSTSGNAIDLVSNAQGDLAIALTGPTDDSGRITVVPALAQPADAASPGVVSWPLPLNDRGGMAFDNAGNVYVSDAKFPPKPLASPEPGFYASDLRLRSIAPDGTIAIILNTFPGGDDINRQSPFPYGYGIATGADGDLYMADSAMHAIYRISRSGQVTLIAGKPGEAGSAD